MADLVVGGWLIDRLIARGHDETRVRRSVTILVDGRPLVVRKSTLLQFPPPNIRVPFRPIHLTLLLTLMGFVLWLAERKKGTHFYWFDFILFFVTGTFGTLFLSLWMFSSHYSVPQNLNLFWLVPSHLVVAFLLLPAKKAPWLQYYFAATSVLMIMVLVAWHWLPLHYNTAAMPLVFLLFLRASAIAFYMQRQK